MKQISVELLNKIANFLVTSVGHSYLETDQLIKELSTLKDVEVATSENKQ